MVFGDCECESAAFVVYDLKPVRLLWYTKWLYGFFEWLNATKKLCNWCQKHWPNNLLPLSLPPAMSRSMPFKWRCMRSDERVPQPNESSDTETNHTNGKFHGIVFRLMKANMPGQYAKLLCVHWHWLWLWLWHWYWMLTWNTFHWKCLKVFA